MELNFRSKVFTIAPTVETGAYASGDLIFNPTVVTLSANSPDASVIRGRILGVTLLADYTAPMDLYVLKTSTSFGTVNSQPNITLANLVAGVISKISVASGDFGVVSANTYIATPDILPVAFECAAALPGSFYVAAVARGAIDFVAATGLTIKLTVEPNNFRF